MIARELSGERVRGSLTRLSGFSKVSLDSLRQLKRRPGSAGSRPLSATRLRLLALLVAAYRMGTLDALLDSAEELERKWRRKHPGAIR
jgi:hypothetical protein